MKRLALLLSTVLCALTACGPMEVPEQDVVQTKFVDKITNAVDGSVIALTYDDEMRITNVTYTNPTDATLDRSYEVKYNLDMTKGEVTFDIFYGGEKYVMQFNEYGALEEFVLDGSTPQVLSKFIYNNYTSVGAFHLELSGIVDNVSGGEAKRIDWSYGTPVNQINQYNLEVENVTYTYSTSLQYSYEEFRSNVHANVNLFNLMVPEYLEHSNIPIELAATVSVFGTRSSYLPTDITVVKGRSQLGENYVKLSEEEREFTYETDDKGYVIKIHKGKDKDATVTKTLLYTITYVDTTDKE